MYGIGSAARWLTAFGALGVVGVVAVGLVAWDRAAQRGQARRSAREQARQVAEKAITAHVDGNAWALTDGAAVGRDDVLDRYPGLRARVYGERPEDRVN